MRNKKGGQIPKILLPPKKKSAVTAGIKNNEAKTSQKGSTEFPGWTAVQEFESVTESSLEIDLKPNIEVHNKITAKCANCTREFKEEIKRHKQFVFVDTNTSQKITSEIQILDAIFYIYGLTIDDWSNTYVAEPDCDYASVTHCIYSEGIPFCDICTIALESVFSAHKTFKSQTHDDSPFVSAIKRKRNIQMPIKKEISTGEVEILNTQNENNAENGIQSFENFTQPGEIFENDDTLGEFDGSQNGNSLPQSILDFKGSNNIKIAKETPILPLKSRKKVDKKPKISLLLENFIKKVKPKKQRSQSFKKSKTEMKLKPRAKYGSCKNIMGENEPTVCRSTLPLSNEDNSISDTSEGPFSISCCDETFDVMAAFENHRLKFHSKTENEIDVTREAKCNICGLPVAVDHVLNHMRSIEHLSSNYFKTVNGDISPKAKTYQQTKESEKQLPCKICGLFFPRIKNLRGHIKRVHPESHKFKFHCGKCSKGFGSEYFLKLHIKAGNLCGLPKRPFACGKCGKDYETSHRLKVHMDTHEDEESSNKEEFKCPKCGKMLKHRYSLQKHLKREHTENQKLFICEQCGKTTKNMTNMRIHMEIHGISRKKAPRPSTAKKPAVARAKSVKAKDVPT